MESIVLEPGAPEEIRDQASEVLAAYLTGFCEAALRELRDQREFLGYCGPLRVGRASTPEARGADRQDVNRSIRRVARLRRDPLPHAKREVRQLADLLERVPFERLAVAPLLLTASLRAFALEEGSSRQASFDICLPSPLSPHFPIFIRRYRSGGEDLMFVQMGRHGACRGEAAALIEMAVERVDLCELVLIALSWARRNL